MDKKHFSRRDFVKAVGAVSGAVVLAACQPEVVKETVMVEKEVEKVVTQVVKETVVIEGTPQVVEKVVEKVVTNTPAPKAATQVSFMVPGSPNEDADFAPVFEAFNEMYDDVEGIYAPAGTGYGSKYNDKVMTMLAGGILPDCFKSLDFFGSLADMGVYVPLDDYIAAEPEITQFDDFFQAHVDACLYKGEMMALPNDGAPVGYWYNVDMFEAEGLELPDWDTTWSEMLASAQEMTKVENGLTTSYGFGRPAWRIWVWSNGGLEMSEDGSKCTLDEPEAIEAMQWIQDSIVEHGVCPGPEALAEISQGERFQTGKLGGFTGARGGLGGLRGIEDFRFDAAPMPKSDKGIRMTQLLIGWTSIWKGSKEYDAAYKLAAFICSQEGQRLRISRGYAHPSRKSLVEEEWYKTYQCPKCNSFGVNSVFPEMLLRGEARALPAHKDRAQIDQVINTELDYLWDGSRPAEQVCQNIATEVNKIVSR